VFLKNSNMPVFQQEFINMIKKIDIQNLHGYCQPENIQLYKLAVHAPAGRSSHKGEN
jgi:hypothetical protein